MLVHRMSAVWETEAENTTHRERTGEQTKLSLGQRNEKFILCGHYNDYLRLLLLAIFCPNLFDVFGRAFNIIKISREEASEALVDRGGSTGRHHQN